jgi:hypothetical protein
MSQKLGHRIYFIYHSRNTSFDSMFLKFGHTFPFLHVEHLICHRGIQVTMTMTNNGQSLSVYFVCLLSNAYVKLKLDTEIWQKNKLPRKKMPWWVEWYQYSLNSGAKIETLKLQIIKKKTRFWNWIYLFSK